VEDPECHLGAKLCSNAKGEVIVMVIYWGNKLGKMKKLVFMLFVLSGLTLQAQKNNADSAIMTSIKREALKNSKSSEILTKLCDDFGPRVMWSPEYTKALDWVSIKLKEWNLQNVNTEGIDLVGKCWSMKKYFAHITEPFFMPLIAYPKVWSPSTNGVIECEVIYLDAKSESDFEKYKGKMKGKIILITEPFGEEPYKILVSRYADSTLQRMENITLLSKEEKENNAKRKEEMDAQMLSYFNFLTQKVAFCKREGALLLLDHGLKYYGITQVWGATMITQAKDEVDFLIKLASLPDTPETVPQMSVSLEQYCHLVRLCKKGTPVKIQGNVDVQFKEPQQGFNLIAEIPGTDLKSEVVMIGAHIDSYHVGLSAADNTVGVVTCMEAMRILQKSGVKPRRTIRIGLWAGEEEGYLGSSAYIKNHFTNGKETCYAYFNMDNGAGRFRGVYAQENEGAKKVFKEWMNIINDPKFKTVDLSEAENTDHVSFDKAGIPGFQFIQDELDYYKIYHTNADMMERVPRDDMKQNAYYMAMFAYLAAMRDGKFPPK